MPLGIDFVQILLHFFNVVILFGGLYVLLYAPVVKFMDKRTEEIKTQQERAGAAEKAAAEKQAEYEEKLAAAEEEIARKKKEAAKEIEELKKRQTADAKAEAKQILADARAQGERERKAIVSGAKEDIAAMIDEAAKKLLQEDEAGDPYENFVKEAERSRRDG
ncbi:MAG: ATP synthase F0 subunit B [Lachnospiraceae bacterium]|nr:ATP synthase F0 subunit B [Lachnospiraceae bacterium]